MYSTNQDNCGDSIAGGAISNRMKMEFPWADDE